MNERAKYPLTHPQQRIWYTDKLYPGTSMWNNAGTLKIKGKLDYSLLRQAALIFIKDNPSLRLQVIEENGRPLQYISDYIPPQVDFIDLSGQGIEALKKLESAWSNESVSLIDSPLYYIVILKLTDSEGCLYVKMHHLISDALSMVSFGGTVMKCYDTLLQGITPQPGDFRLGNYLDYMADEEKYMESPRRENDRAYWLDKFSGLSEPTSIKPKPSGQGTRAKRKTYTLDDSLCSKVRSFCSLNRISEFTLFLSALAVYIYRTGGKKDIVINTPVYNRTNRTNKSAFGMYISTVPLRMEICEDQNFTQFAQNVSDMWFSSLRHQKYPYDLLLQELRKNGGISEAPSDITLSFQNGMFVKGSELFTYEGCWHFNGHQANGLNIHISDRNTGGRYIIEYDFLTPMFTQKQIEYIHRHLISIIESVSQTPDKPLHAIEILTAQEREELLVSFNDTSYPFPKRGTLPQVWLEWVERTPDNIAVICGGESYTYSEIDAMARSLAVKLRSMGVGPGRIVGVTMNRSAQVIAAELGILMAGGAFLPIDPILPLERALYMLENSGADILVTTPQLAPRFREASVEAIIAQELESTDELPEIINESTDLCYIIYTSGSTGKPKGVMIEHGMLLNYIYSTSELLHFTSGYNTLCASSISFDVNVMEIYCSLLNGGTLVMAMEHEVNIPSNMTALIRSAGVNEMVLTPGRLELLLSDPGTEDCLKDFADIIMAGDVLPMVLLTKLRKLTKARLYNFYGPTEITIVATYKDVTNSRDANIGKPLRNVTAYILDTHLNPVSVGVIGELYIGGAGVARGYINNPELTAQRFIDSPFRPGERLYKTGDLMRFLPNGDIDFLGRSDTQIKIRGYRVELGEIEEHIKKIDGIVMCAVCAFDDALGHKALCAYISGEDIPPVSQIKSTLSGDLPPYMVPSYFMVMDSLPLNNSAKIDRLRLPKPEAGNQRIQGAPPSGDTEKKIADIWSELLGVGQVYREDSYFDLGGDSLSIVQCVSMIKYRLGVEVSLEELYRNPTLEQFALLADRGSVSASGGIAPVPNKRSYPASSAQKRLYAIHKAEPSSLAYNMPMLFVLGKQVDAVRLEKVFRKLIKRHEAFRTVLSEKDGEIVQSVIPRVDFALGHKTCAAGEVKRTARGLVYPFDLTQPPLIRAALIDAGKQYLFVDTHHSVSDLQTTRMLFSELGILFSGGSLPPVTLQYRDYSVWHSNWLSSPESIRQGQFWAEHLSGELPVLSLPTSKQRGIKQSFSGGEERVTIPALEADSLRVAARTYDATVFMIILAAYNILLSKYSGAEDIIVAVPHHGRTRPEFKNTAGMFVGTLPVRSRPEGGMSFGSFLESVKESCTKAFINSDYPLEMMLSKLKLTRDPSRNPLFDVMLVYQTNIEDGITYEELSLKPVKLPSPSSKLDLTLEVTETRTGLECRFEYDSAIYDRADIRRMADSFALLLSVLPERLDTRLSELSVLSDVEYDKLTRAFSGIRKHICGDVVSIFESVAEKFADKTALTACDGSLSFYALNKRSNAIARALREAGIRSGDTVALTLRRTTGLIASMLGVLKAGGAYLPVDLSYPSDRIAFMLSDSGTGAVILDERDDKEFHFTGKRLFLDEIGGECGNAPRTFKPDDPSYVIYTSGSTGIPKGVVLTREGLYNLYEGSREPVGYVPELTAISLTTASFDIFIAETLLPLLNGCSVVLCDEEQMRQPHLTAELMEAHGVSFLQSTPSRLSAMLTDKTFRRAAAGLRLIVGGGEKWTAELVRSLNRHTDARLVNGYAPSETTVYSTFSEIKDANRITIGRPIQNTSFYILDRYGKPVPVGVQGEAYIGGAGVGIGYINRFELTQERFLTDTFSEGRLYRTGDICSFTCDGEIAIYGRSDDQIKLHGLRIEPGEIEQNMRKYPGITEAAVKYFPEGGGYLCGFFTSEHVTIQQLRSFLSGRLPAYMVPSQLVCLESFPMTGSGKINRAVLKSQGMSARGTVQSMTSIQRALARIWSRVLGVIVTSPDNSFFDLGGDSLSVIKVQAAMYARGMRINTRDFYALRTLGAISEAVSGKIIVRDTAIPRQRRTVSDTPLSPVNLDRVLLTGATGYVGAHILAELVESYGSRIYCLVRGADTKSVTQSLRETLEFYFGGEAGRYMDSVTVLKGDISLSGLGIRGNRKALLDISCVIHSAALTSHAGYARDFENANVTGTSNVTEFCLKVGVPLLHVSTMSVAGTRFTDGRQEDGVFDESCYYIGQNYNTNDYVRSKFLAEGIVLDAAEKGLDVRIFRAGNLTGRYADGRFQRYPERNAFANRLKAIRLIKAIPQSSGDGTVEMTPVDLFAKAMLSIAARGGERTLVYHLANPFTVSVSDIATAIGRLGGSIRTLSDSDFISRAQHISRTKTGGEIASLLRELAEESEGRQIKAELTSTLEILRRCGFEWAAPDSEYLNTLLVELFNLQKDDSINYTYIRSRKSGWHREKS